MAYCTLERNSLESLRGNEGTRESLREEGRRGGGLSARQNGQSSVLYCLCSDAGLGRCPATLPQGPAQRHAKRCTNCKRLQKRRQRGPPEGKTK